jgi:glycosyltransferase involved in cell wall biosynthesis
MEVGVQEATRNRKNVFWIREMVDKKTLIELYSHAGVFCCPSIYEPFGIINLEAMACETPVVASAVGGIPEVVIDNETGLLVPLNQMQESPFEATEPDAYSRALAEGVNRLMGNKDLLNKMAAAGRKRVEEVFSWKSIAEQTLELYKNLLRRKSNG